jgi:hypothetical protein
MTEAVGFDRRQVPRYRVRLPVSIVAWNADITGVPGHTIDLSLHGLRAVTEIDLVHGEEQTVVIDVSPCPIVVQAEVVHTERQGRQWVHGLLFADVAADDADRLAQLCRPG